MKKALFIMAAALLMMTQCRKENATPNMPADGTVKMTVTAGPGRTDINTATGAITWSEGDKLYVSDGTNWLGSLTLIGDGGSSQGLFTGNVAIGGGTTPCHFFYLGRDNGMTEPKAGTGTDAVISLVSQDGTLAGAMKYHIGYGTTAVTVTEGGYEGYVLMNTKIAMAHISFTTDGTTAYTKPVNMGGEGFCNTMTVSPDGSFSGSGTDGIAIGNGGGTTGERYVTLIPTGETSIFVAFTGDATGSMAFANGIVENKFYGMKDAIAVTLEAAAPKFSVGENTTVEFAPGNLYWDGTNSNWKFEADQWSTTPASDGTWDESHVSHFYWSEDAAEAIKEEFNWGQPMSTGDVFFTNSTETTANPDFHVNGETGTNTWRTLSRAEWNYLLGYDPEQWTQTETYGRPGAKAKSAWKDLGGGVKGLVILPDDTEDPETVMGSINSTADLATHGAVFLPAAGYRNGAVVDDAGSFGDFWSGTPYEVYDVNAYYMDFDSGYVYVGSGRRNLGFSVRLVR